MLIDLKIISRIVEQIIDSKYVRRTNQNCKYRGLWSNFSLYSNSQTSGNNRIISYENENEIIEALQQNFKVNFYLLMIDIAISKLDECFTILKEHNDVLEFVNDSFIKANREKK